MLHSQTQTQQTHESQTHQTHESQTQKQRLRTLTQQTQESQTQIQTQTHTLQTHKGGMIQDDSGTVFCGIRTRVQRDQGGGDDTALNGVQFKCCS